MKSTQPTKKTVKKSWQSFVGSSTWSLTQKAIIYLIFSLGVNHLANRESFPGGESYRFPIEGFITSLALCILIGTIAEINFKHYKKKYFSRKVEFNSIARYMASTLGYVTIIYIPLGIILKNIAGGELELYYLIIGLLITLLVSFILIGLAYAQDIYNLYAISMKDAEITIESGSKMKKLTYENIACFYSENKIVYTIKNNGNRIITDFTLNQLEETLNDQLFFRANRQIIIHKSAVDQIEKIENGKLRIQLKAPINTTASSEIIISRYKRNEFLKWFQ